MKTRFVGVMLLFLMMVVPTTVEALNVRVAALGPDTVVIEWDESSASDFGYYEVWRAEGDSPSHVIVDVWVDRSKTKYTDSDVHAGTKYSYMVRVLDNQDRPIDQGSVSATPCLARDWMMFAGGVLLIFVLMFILVLTKGGGLPPQILLPIIMVVIAVAGAMMWASNVPSDIPACP